METLDTSTWLGVVNSVLLLLFGVSLRGGSLKSLLRALGEASASESSTKGSQPARTFLDEFEGRMRKAAREELEQVTAPLRADLARIETDLREVRRDVERRLAALEQSQAFTRGQLAVPSLMPSDPTPIQPLQPPRNNKAEGTGT